VRAGLATRRAWVVAALLVVGALDLHSTAVGLRAHARLRARSLDGVRQSALLARARVAPVVAAGGPEVMARVAAIVEPRHAASMIRADRSVNLSYRRDSR